MADTNESEEVLADGDRLVLGELSLKSGDPRPKRREVEPYLAALLQSEHLNLLVGAGLTAGLAHGAKVEVPDMSAALSIDHEDLHEAVEFAATKSAGRTGRGDSPNLEDRLRVAIAAETGLRIAGDERADKVAEAIGSSLQRLTDSVATTEAGIAEGSTSAFINDLTLVGTLISFLGAFVGRPPTRDRAHVFTTNYDRVIEWGAERAGLRVVDRFVGTLQPVFRSSRLEIDLHYSPPGTMREPRHLDGVFRLTKLHGSLDWRWDADRRQVTRTPTPFGEIPSTEPPDTLIFPNAAKDFETAFHPYSELFRDLSAALCRPHSVLVTYGYSFGDDHINRVIADMLTIPSTHLVVISFDDPGGRIGSFIEQHRRFGQVSLLLGPSFAGLGALVAGWLPVPSAEFLLQRRAAIYRSRDAGPETSTPPPSDDV